MTSEGGPERRLRDTDRRQWDGTERRGASFSAEGPGGWKIGGSVEGSKTIVAVACTALGVVGGMLLCLWK